MATKDNKDDINPMISRDENTEYEQYDDFNMSDEMYTTEIRSHHSSQTSYNLKLREEEILSQKISQLSTKNTIIEKLSMVKDIQQEIHKIPNYLTKQNKSFKQIIDQALSTMAIQTTNHHDRKKLRHIVILLHKIKVIPMYHRLWTTYLKSGLGHLMMESKQKFNYPTNLKIWPKEMKTMLQSAMIDATNEHEIFVDFVNHHLHELDHQFKHIQMEWNRKANNFNGYTLIVEKLFEKYIEQNLSYLRMEIEHKIELIHYDYHMQAVKIEFSCHHPNEYQKKLFKQLCHSKYEQEMTEQEFNFLQQQIIYYKSPSQSFENSPIAQSRLINSIQNSELQQQLFNQYKQIAVQSKALLLDFYIKTAEEQRNEYRKKYNEDVKKMWSDHRTLPDNENISLPMLDLINERCKKIDKLIINSNVQLNMNVNESHLIDDPPSAHQRKKEDPSIRKKSKTNLMKRKRDVSLQQQSNLNTTIPKSTSSISILQPALKKVKHKQKTITNTNISSIEVQQNTLKRTYRRPMYLKRSPKILIKMLSKTLNYTFKEKADERFIVARLDLFDRFYCLRIDLQLWESYLDIGLQQHLWPDRLYTIAKTNDFENCHQYLLNHINDLKINLDQYQMELDRQSQPCPITTLSLDQIDHCLNEFVICQRKYLLMKNNNQLLKFKDNFHDKDLFKTVSTFRLTIDRNAYINQLLLIREKQGEIYEELLILEMRILCKFLPQNFDQLQYFIKPITYSPLNNNQKAVQVKNKCYKIIQEAKRLWLNILFNACEIKIQAYDSQYQNIFLQLESQSIVTNNVNDSSISNQIKEYLIYRTNKLKQDIYKKVAKSRAIVLQIRQHSSSSRKQKIIGVSPEPYIDLISHQFVKRQWNHLSLGKNFLIGQNL
ncbi:unnamed protein product [Rotaria socialis]